MLSTLFEAGQARISVRHRRLTGAAVTCLSSDTAGPGASVERIAWRARADVRVCDGRSAVGRQH